jgi:glutamine synthetase
MAEQDIIIGIKESNKDTIRFAVADIDGILRGKIINKNKFLKGIEHGIGFCNVIFGWDSNDVCYDNGNISGWHNGYPDAIASIDLSTHRNIPWNDAIDFFLADFSNDTKTKAACPRTLLKQIKQQCEVLGFKAVFAKEFEWFNFKETPESLHQKSFINPTPLSPGMFGYSILRSSEHRDFYNSLFYLLKQFNIPLEGLHTETGNGVYEAAIEYADVLEAADRAVLFKTGVKEIAYQHGLVANFMAKWNSNLPGCSGHIHQNLFDDKNNNLFYDVKNLHGMSNLMKHYIAGQLYCLPHIMPMYAPTINSYKRYIEGAWAATSVSWGIENRTTALRVINHTSASTRLETRVPGADANPYLSMAAALASGLYGIKHQLPLTVDATEGNEYDNKSATFLPKTLFEATDAMKHSDIAAELFGEAFVDHFIRTREWEWKQFSQKVTDWELKRYFEII